MSEKKVGPSDLNAEVERLKAAGKFPTLEEVLDAVAEARQKFARKILNARQQQGSAALDCVTRSLIENGIALTQRNWIEAAYLGDKSSIDQLDGEELADLPEGFEEWPVDELGREFK
jgi:hypothetical protein